MGDRENNPAILVALMGIDALESHLFPEKDFPATVQEVPAHGD